MFTSKVAVLCLAVALLAVSSASFAGIYDPCSSTATLELSGAVGLPVTLPACPQGDGGSMISRGLYVALTIRDAVGNGIPGIPPSDIWMHGCDRAQFFVLSAAVPVRHKRIPEIALPHAPQSMGSKMNLGTEIDVASRLAAMTGKALGHSFFGA